MSQFTRLLMAVMFSAMVVRLNAQVATGQSTTSSQVTMAPSTPSYPPMMSSSRIMPQLPMEAQQVLSQPTPANATKLYPLAGMTQGSTTNSNFAKPTPTQTLPPAQASYSSNSPAMGKNQSSTMNDTMATLPNSNATSYLAASTLPQVNQKTRNMTLPLDPSTIPAPDMLQSKNYMKPTSTQTLPPAQSSYSLNSPAMVKNQSSTMNDTMATMPHSNAASYLAASTLPQVNQKAANMPSLPDSSTYPAQGVPQIPNSMTQGPTGGNATMSQTEASAGLDRSSEMRNSTLKLEKVRNPIIPTTQMVMGNGTASYQPVNQGNLTTQKTLNPVQPLQSEVNSTVGIGQTIPSDNGEMIIPNFNQQIATEKFNSRIEKNPTDDQLTQKLLNQLQSASKQKLSMHQIANQTAFLNSLDAEQKVILESKLKGFQLTPTQQQLERDYLASFVSEKTKAAHQAGFDAIKKGLSPEAQKSFDATEGMQSLQLTDEEKYRFEEGSREFLEDPQSRFDSASIRLSINFFGGCHIFFISLLFIAISN